MITGCAIVLQVFILLFTLTLNHQAQIKKMDETKLKAKTIKRNEKKKQFAYYK